MHALESPAAIDASGILAGGILIGAAAWGVVKLAQKFKKDVKDLLGFQ